MTGKRTNTINKAVIQAYSKLVAEIDGLEQKGATMPYTSVNGHMFSFLAADGSLALRLPTELREEFLEKYKTTLCEAHGTILKEYVVVPAKLFFDRLKMSKYFRESYDYVSSLKPKATKKTAPAKEKPAVQTNQGNAKVDDFLKKSNNPMTAEIQRVREIILGVSDKIEEDIKWSAPTFMYKGNIASFFMNAKKHVSLMFHNGASIPDKKSLLEGDGVVSRVAKFADMKDIEKKKTALQAVIKEWIKLKDAK